MKCFELYPFQRDAVDAALEGDHRALSEIYESLAFEYPMRKAISEGYLVPVKAKMLPVEL